MNKSTDRLIAYFNAHCTNPAYRQHIAEKLAFAQESVQAAGKNLLMDRGQRKVYFAELLAAKKDSVVVIDFWATWCKPCLEEAPHLEALKKRWPAKKCRSWPFRSTKTKLLGWAFTPKAARPSTTSIFCC